MRTGRNPAARTVVIGLVTWAMVAGFGGGCDDDAPSADDTATATDTTDTDTDTDTVPEDSVVPGDTDATPADTAEDTVEPADTTLPTDFSLACDRDADCLVACGAGVCETGRCVFARLSDACVIVDASENRGHCEASGGSDPDSGCRFCNPKVQSTGYTSVVYAADFETGLSGMVALNLTGSDAAWSVTNQRAAGGIRSAYFGDASKDTYGVGERARGTLTTPPLAFPTVDAAQNVTLTFELFLDTEETAAFDYLRILVDRGDGAPVVVWHSDVLDGTTLGVFLPISVGLGALPAEGASVIFEFDSVDDKINGFEGAYLDNVQVTTGCCAADTDCDDANLCTVDRCDTGDGGGRCGFDPVPGCCLRDIDCEDGDACTLDTCSGTDHTCSSAPEPGCCSVGTDCNDSNACTEDLCDAGGGCVNRPICCSGDGDCDDGDVCTAGTCDGGECRYALACCAIDTDCDDGDACTRDRCVGDSCLNVFEPGPGCCKPDILTERFDAPLPPGWTLDPAINNIGWRLQATADAQSGAQVLYYGHPTLNWYDSGNINQGDARSALFQIPEGVDARLTMRVLLDLETDPNRDKFTVFAEAVGQTIPLVDKQTLTLGTFQSVDVNVGYLAGQSVRIVLRMETIDDQSNQRRGVLVDDLRITSTCQPRPCTNESACTSQTPCVAGRCDGGGCDYEAADCE